MQRSRLYPLWIDEAGEMDLRYRHVSYVLFRADGEDTVILASRCPEPERFAAGRALTDGLRLDEEALCFLLSPRENGLLVIRTELGIGVLDKRYVRQGGIGVYWHVHGEARGLGRLICNGVLGEVQGGEYAVSASVLAMKGRVRAQDMPLYAILSEAWDRITVKPAAWAREDGCGCVYGEDLARAMEKMADFVGVRMIRDGAETSEGVIPVGRVGCRRPVWLEICLLYLLTEGRALSANGRIHYGLKALGDVEEGGLSLQFRYSLEDPERHAEALDPIHRYLERIGELHGMEFHAEATRLKRGERGRGILPEMRFYLDWLSDPAVLSTSDLKADPELDGADASPK